MTATPTTTPVETPTVAPNVTPWPERFTDPIHVCPQQRRELASPDVLP